MPEYIACEPKYLPADQSIAAAKTAVEINPVNHPPVERLVSLIPGFTPTREHLAVLTTKYWYSGGVKLTVGFLDSPPSDLRARILAHMNAWGQTANVSFLQTSGEAQVRIARTPGNGHWSFIGTDILQIAKDKPTMNLDSFSMETPEQEYHRVVRHEAGHTIGFPHEHLRKELVDKIDPEKAIQYFGEKVLWNRDEVIQQVLTPIEESSLLGTPSPDPNSIMCYQIPGLITKDGQPIPGGFDIDAQDSAFAAQIYPKVGAAAAVEPSVSGQIFGRANNLGYSQNIIEIETPSGWRIRVAERVNADALRAVLDIVHQ